MAVLQQDLEGSGDFFGVGHCTGAGLGAGAVYSMAHESPTFSVPATVIGCIFPLTTIA